jgi:two-component system sensor histidine kinase ArlS
MKLSFKINLLFTGIVCCILSGMSLLVFNISRQSVYRDFRVRIKNRAERADYLFTFLKTDTSNLLKSLDANTPPVLYKRYVGIYDSTYKQLYEFHDSDADLIIPEREWLRAAKDKSEYFVTKGKKTIGVFHFNNPIIVIVSAEDITGRSFINNLRNVLVIYFPLAMIATLVAGYLFSRSVVRPLQQTIHDMKLITSQNLSHRLYNGKSRDEIARLNDTFNALLDRLEESFAMVKRFISNASHELSTPLTSISSQVEVALLQNRSQQEYKHVLESVLMDIQDLRQLTRNLLEIAKAGTNGAISLEKIRIDEVLVKAHSDVLLQDRAYKVELDFSELPDDERECMVFGNTHLLQSAFKNIIENGCKYSPDSRTKVALLFNGTEARIRFSNRSVFLSADEIEKLYEPFYRGENAERKPGFGLGLTLTKKIIGIHKGTLVILSEKEGGTSILVTLPSLKA